MVKSNTPRPLVDKPVRRSTGVKKRKRNGVRGRRFAMTYNNPTPEQKKFFKDVESLWNKDKTLDVSQVPFRFGIGQLELAPTTGTPHIQGYIELTKVMARSTLQKKLPGNPALFVSKGTAQDNITYCTKPTGESEPWRFRFGKVVTQGYRSDLVGTANQVADECIQGNTLEEIEDAHPGYYMANKSKVIDYHMSKNTPKERHDKKFIIMIGPSGAGKSVTARTKFDSFRVKTVHKDAPLWFDRYTGEEAVVFTEFGRGKISYTDIKKLVDYESQIVDIKHGSLEINPKYIIVTTREHPKTWYPGIKDKDELRRRIREMGEIWNFKGEGEYPNFEYDVESTDDFEFDSFVDPEYTSYS